MSVGLSALAQQGITAYPIGTLDEVKEAGHDPSKVACCHPFGLDEGGGKIRGCPMWKACRFDKAKLGGFKGQGPRNVGWATITDEGTANAAYGPCYTYTGYIQGNADFGAELRRQGKVGALIRIVAQEGGEIEQRITLPYTLAGEIVNQDSETADRLEAQGLKVYRGDRMIEATTYKPTIIKTRVPEFPRPNQLQDLTFVQRMIGREMDRLALEEQVEEEIAQREFDRSLKGAPSATAEPVKKAKHP